MKVYTHRQMDTHTVMWLSIPLLLHGELEAAVKYFVQRVDPLLHLTFRVGGQQIRTLILHLQFKCKSAHLIILHRERQERLELP